jgi:hypothetical protein
MIFQIALDWGGMVVGNRKGFVAPTDQYGWSGVCFWEILVITAIFTEYDGAVTTIIYQAFTVVVGFVAGGDPGLSACLEGGISAGLSWVAADVY